MHGWQRDQMRVAGRSRGRASRVGRRGAWPHLAAVLFAYALALCGSPVGQAGFLWMHIATSHDAAPPPAASPRSPDVPAFPARIVQADPGSASRVDEDAIVAPVPSDAKRSHGHAHPHQHGSAADRHAHAERPAAHREHEDQSRDEARDDAKRPAAPIPPVIADAPHEHGGTWHTHQPHPVEDADVLTNGVSKFYLASREVPPQPRNAGRTPLPPIVAAPSGADPAVEVPPPQLTR
jgi:hypothetical protein